MGRIKNEDIMNLLSGIATRLGALEGAKAAPSATVATRVQQAATSPAKPAKARKGRAKGAKREYVCTDGPMLDGLRMFEHPTQPGYARLYFYDSEGNQLARVRTDDKDAQAILSELRATPLSPKGKKQMHFLRAEKCWSGRLELFPARIRAAIKLEGPK